MAASPVTFIDFELNLATGELRQAGRPVRLEQQPARALVHLVAHAGQLVTRDALCRAIWPDGTHVDFDRGLNYCIRHLRAALNDDARRPRFIETIPRQGYRFVAMVDAPIDGGAARPWTTTARTRGWLRTSLRHLVTVAAVLGALLCDSPGLKGPGPHARDSHHRIAMAAARGAHDFLFGPAARPSAHHQAAVAVTRAIHQLAF